MNESPQLTPDQHAVLALLLRQRKSYADVAGMLKIDEQAVRGRAYEAIATLGSGEGTSLLHSHREEIGDYLLGQRTELSQATSAYLLTLSNARAWAQTIRTQLQSIAPGPLPELPEPARAAPEPPPRPQPPPQPVPAGGVRLSEAYPASLSAPPAASASRRAGALLLVAILAVVVVAVVLIVNGGGSGNTSTRGETQRASTGSATTQASSTASRTPTLDSQAKLTAPEPGEPQKGIVYVASEGGRRAFYLTAEHLAPSTGFFYVAWLYDSPTKAVALGKAPLVKSNGSLEGAGPLPSGSSKYHRFIVTEETNEHAAQPGKIVLSGPFKLHSSGASKTIPSPASTGASSTSPTG
jgi:hypothetical protein